MASPKFNDKKFNELYFGRSTAFSSFTEIRQLFFQGAINAGFNAHNFGASYFGIGFDLEPTIDFSAERGIYTTSYQFEDWSSSDSFNRPLEDVPQHTIGMGANTGIMVGVG